MASLTNYAEDKLRDHLLGITAYTMPTDVYLALYTAAPDETGGGTECTGGSYARQVWNVGVSGLNQAPVLTAVTDRRITAGEFVTRDFTWLADWPILLNFLTHASLALELLYPILIWIGPLRPLVLAGVVMLHLGIAGVSPGLTEFGLAMILANVAFVAGSWLRGLCTGPEQPGLRVLFDGACPRCRASMALLTAADPDRTLEPVDLTAVDVSTIHPGLTRAACMESMHVVSRTGKIQAGFDAVRAAFSWLPLFWPLAVIGWIPGVAWAGRRSYNYLAATRPRDVPCTDEVCGIDSGPRHAKSGGRGRPLVSSKTIATDHRPETRQR